MSSGTPTSTQSGSLPVSSLFGGDPLCACGHVYDEHDDGQECEAEVYDRSSDTYQKCMCVYYDEAPADE